MVKIPNGRQQGAHMDIPPENHHKAQFPVRAAELDRLRQAQGLSLERLASKADIHVKTLKRILDGQEARLGTIHLLAEVLGVPCEQLRADIPQKQEPRITVKIELGIPMESFAGSAQGEFIDLLKALLQSTDRINVLSVVQGSTIVTLEMSQADALRLALAASTPESIEALSQFLAQALVLAEAHDIGQVLLEYRPTEDCKMLTPESALRRYNIFKLTFLFPFRGKKHHRGINPADKVEAETISLSISRPDGFPIILPDGSRRAAQAEYFHPLEDLPNDDKPGQKDDDKPDQKNDDSPK
jgi:transcriptional regulator with XRE-family HTH domain